MNLFDLETAIYYCDQKIIKLGAPTSTVDEQTAKDIAYWKAKKEGLEALMEKEIRAMVVPKTKKK